MLPRNAADFWVEISTVIKWMKRKNKFEGHVSKVKKTYQVLNTDETWLDFKKLQKSCVLTNDNCFNLLI